MSRGRVGRVADAFDNSGQCRMTRVFPGNTDADGHVGRVGRVGQLDHLLACAHTRVRARKALMHKRVRRVRGVRKPVSDGSQPGAFAPGRFPDSPLRGSVLARVRDPRPTGPHRVLARCPGRLLRPLWPARQRPRQRPRLVYPRAGRPNTEVLRIAPVRGPKEGLGTPRFVATMISKTGGER